MATHNTASSPLIKHALDVFKTFLLLGFSAFGGPAAHIGFFRKTFVEQKKWLSDVHFGQLLALCQFLPGPASSQLGFLIGLTRAGWAGAILAFIAFTLPTAVVLIAFALSLQAFTGDIAKAILHGLKIVALVVVADALWGMAKKLCPDTKRQCIALLSASAVIIFSFSYIHIVIILLTGLAGYAFYHNKSEHQASAVNTLSNVVSQKAGILFLVLFILILLCLPFLATTHPLLLVFHIFYNAGALVFGGGHVVLPLLEQNLVPTGMISQSAFLAGYGASQAMPGPLFSFAAYLGAVIEMGYSPVITGIVALLAIFLPGFLLVLGILPFWQRLASKPAMAGAVMGVNAGVVGLLAAVLYAPVFTQAVIAPSDMVIALIGLGLLCVLRLSPLWVVAWCVVAQVLVAAF